MNLSLRRERALLKYLAILTIIFPAVAVAQPQEWLVTTDMYGNPLYQYLEIEDTSGALTGNLGGDALKGNRAGSKLHFEAGGSLYDATLGDGKMTGAADMPDTNDQTKRAQHSLIARRLPAKPAKPRHIDFVPTSWSNEFSAHKPPVETIWPGDTVHTTTIDSGGVDEHGVTRALYGNPQTGPFFVRGAMPGDTLAIHIDRLKLNRNYAESLDTIVSRALTAKMAADAKDLGKPVRWRLDIKNGVARPENAQGALADFSVPLRPMLGCIAVAPDFGFAPFSTGDSGRFGGNMDFNGIVEGATVYLPVYQPGALLYLGDAHAAQGDGETTQYGLETSMDVTFHVEVIHSSVAAPRVRSTKGIMALGFGGSTEDALRMATAGLAQWLEHDYGLTISQTAQVFGGAMHYTVSELADRNVGVVAWLDADVLKGLKAAK